MTHNFGISREDSAGRQPSSCSPVTRRFTGGARRVTRSPSGLAGVIEGERRMSEFEFVGMLRSLEVTARLLGGGGEEAIQICLGTL